MNTFIGIVTFGNLDFTKLAVRSIRETVEKYDYEILIVVGKPGDEDTLQYCKDHNIAHIVHDQNYGFPYSLNDMYDWGFIDRDYDNYIAMGNDVVAYPYAIDSLITVANETDFEWICAREYDVKSLYSNFPEVRSLFTTGSYKFESFDQRPWELFKNYSDKIIISTAGLSDVHNLSLFKKSVFDKIGYIDVNFYPAYYEDNDYARRAVHANIKSCTLDNAFYFHFWSRTIKQETGGSNHAYFKNNKRFYKLKWGGDFGKEKHTVPFNGKDRNLTEDIVLKGSIKIDDRTNEKDIINFWKPLG